MFCVVQIRYKTSYWYLAEVQSFVFILPFKANQIAELRMNSMNVSWDNE
jgi:hypothetical protein